MRTNTSINLSVQRNPDGFTISGGQQGRGLTVTSGDVTLIGGAIIQDGIILVGNGTDNSFDHGYLGAGTGIFIESGAGFLKVHTVGLLSLSETGQFYPASNPSGFITGLNTGDFITASQTGQFASANSLYQTGADLIALINSSSNGVTQLNNLTGNINITGAGNIFVSVENQLIYVSGDTGAYANFATLAQLVDTGSNLYQIITGLSGAINAANYYPSSNPSGFITGINTGDFVTRSETGQFASDTELTQTGVILTSTIINSGNAAVNHANGIGINLSGNLTLTGQNLYQRTTGLSGYLIGLINAASAGVSSINGQSGVMTIEGTGGISVFTQGQTIYISGEADPTFFATVPFVTGISGVLQGYIDLNDTKIFNTGFVLYHLITGLSGFSQDAYYPLHQNPSGFITTGQTGQFYPASNPQQYSTSGNLIATGSILDQKINSLSGFTLGTSGGLEIRIFQTGNSSVLHANGIGVNLSGNLTQTGVNLINRDNDISGALQTLINELYPRSNPSGYITGISTGDFVTRNETGQFYPASNPQNYSTSGDLIATGNSAVNHANGIGSGLSGNLTLTGSTLDNKINSLSGYSEGIFVHRTGNEFISGRKHFLDAFIQGSGHTIALGASGSFAQGFNNRVSGIYAHAEGQNTIASGNYSHAEGILTRALGSASHAEGIQTTANGISSHAEGTSAISFANSSHAEGDSSVSSGIASHAEGFYSVAVGIASHSEGHETRSLANFSHAEGNNTISDREYAHAQGLYNRTGVSGLFQVGRGTSVSDRKDVIYVSDTESNASILSGRWHFETGAQIGDSRILTGLIAGTGVVVQNNNDGTFTVNVTGVGSASNSDGINLSGNLTQTGIALILRDNDISGVLQSQINELYPRSNPSGYITGISTGEFATKLELFNTGSTLITIINNTGNSAIIHANGIGSGLSGALTQYVQTGTILAYNSGIQTGIEEQYFNFLSHTFASIPTVNATLETSNSPYGYWFVISGKSQTGFWAIFSDMVLETGYYLNILAKY